MQSAIEELLGEVAVHQLVCRGRKGAGEPHELDEALVLAGCDSVGGHPLKRVASRPALELGGRHISRGLPQLVDESGPEERGQAVCLLKALQHCRRSLACVVHGAGAASGAEHTVEAIGRLRTRRGTAYAGWLAVMAGLRLREAGSEIA